ncbi:MAG: hypothetical protein RR835_12870 [Peptostreptococcaceae bacterium]
MCSNIDDLKNDLDTLCIEYISILRKLKNENIIDEEKFKSCTDSKFLFIEE